MNFLLLQTFLLLLASYFLGAFLACLVKRTFMGAREPAPAHASVPRTSDVPPPAAVAVAPPPVRVRAPRHVAPPVAPRPFDHVQPKIEVLKRPPPRPVPKLIDPRRFERALMGPEPNEGMPRKAIVEIRPAVLKPVTGAYRPGTYRPPSPPVEEISEALSEQATPAASPATEPSAESSPATSPAARAPSDATTAAAAAGVAAAKAAAAASIASAARASLATATPSPQGSTEGATEPAPKPSLKPAPVVTLPIEGGDDFQRIRAIDAEIERKLKAEGVNYFEHIAAWTAADIKRFGQLLEIPGRIDREQWVEQAQILAKGGETYYSRNRLAALKANAQVPAPEILRTQPLGSSAEIDNPPSVPSPSPTPPTVVEDQTPTVPELSGVAAASQGRSVAEMAASAAAAIAAASASVTRGLRPIEPISPLAKVDPNISIPAKLSDAIRGKEAATAPAAAEKRDLKLAMPEGPQDDLKRIRGIGVLIEKRLNGMGITRYEQIANWTGGDIDRVSQILEFKGRIERENWVEQARILASGGQTEFSGRFDRGEVDTSRDT
jgi:predicted flap endonuclease-1-like 5' DNA nuclease